MERSLRSCSVLDVIGSQRPQYFKLVMLEDKKQKKKARDAFDLPGLLEGWEKKNIIHQVTTHLHHQFTDITTTKKMGIKSPYLHLVD